MKLIALALVVFLSACGGGDGKEAVSSAPLLVSGQAGSMASTGEAHSSTVIASFAYTNNTGAAAMIRVTIAGQAKFSGPCFNCYVSQVVTVHGATPVDYSNALPVFGTAWSSTPLYVDVPVPAGIVISGEASVGFVNATGPITMQWSDYTVEVRPL